MRHVLQEQEPRFSARDDLEHMLEEVAPFGAFQTLLVTCFRERLAREAGAENVMAWDILRGNLADVS
jgi:hypothetical protein